jgi:hypothetical protein
MISTPPTVRPGPCSRQDLAAVTLDRNLRDLRRAQR